MAQPFANFGQPQPFVVQGRGSKSLHFSIGEVQSRMSLSRPDELQIDYTRTMMGFLLLNPQPRHITMIGLGGGSLAKFCHRHLLATAITVVEISPEVVALRREFLIPDDDARLRVITGDGATHVQRCRAEIDVLLVDGFDPNGQPQRLSSPGFYDDCREALAPGGILVVNLHADHPQHAVFAQRIAQTFAGNAVQVLAQEQSNCIVLAARERPVTLDALRQSRWSRVLSDQVRRELKAEFDQIGWNASMLAVSVPATGTHSNAS